MKTSCVEISCLNRGENALKALNRSGKTNLCDLYRLLPSLDVCQKWSLQSSGAEQEPKRLPSQAPSRPKLCRHLHGNENGAIRDRGLADFSDPILKSDVTPEARPGTLLVTTNWGCLINFELISTTPLIKWTCVQLHPLPFCWTQE